MDKKTFEDWHKFLNPKEIKKNLLDASLFLSFFEILNTAITDRIFDFYCNEFRDGKFITSDKYKEVILERLINDKKNTFLSSCTWLLESKTISQDDFDKIIKIKEHRNRIAHDLPKFLFDSDYTIDKTLFDQIKELTLKIEKWWIVEVEIPTNPDLDGKEIDYEGIVPGQDIILTYIYNIANANIEDLDKAINDESQLDK